MRYTVLAAGLLLATIGLADEIALSDGRVLHDAVIQSQTEETVCIRHSDGISSVRKELLPSALRERYPVQPHRPETSTVQPAAHPSRPARAVSTPLPSAETAPTSTPAETRHRQALRQDATLRIGRYFRERAQSAITDVECFVTITEFRAINGTEGPWLVRGEVTIDYLVHGTKRTTFDEQYHRDYGVPLSPVNLSRHVDRCETKSFEAIYTEGPQPVLDVTAP